MTMQITDIVIYSHDGRRRELTLNAGSVNIVTGSSKSGKSALVDIVDYCFGADTCRVPEGPIRSAVSWFGLRLQLSEGQAFIARRCPSPHAASSEDCFVDIADAVEVPLFEALRQTTNTKGLGSLLDGWVGIADNVYEPPPGNRRPPVSANARHALVYCFQPQDEIIRRNQLFHSAGDPFIAQALKDSLPYFLGAVDDDFVRKRGELRRVKEQLRDIEKQLAELSSLRGGGTGRAAALLSQARDVGLTESASSSWEESVAGLRTVVDSPIAAATDEYPAGMEFSRLSLERRQLLDVQRRLREEVAAARSFEEDERGYSEQASEQQARLSSISIFSDADAAHACPLCSQELRDRSNVPSVRQLNETLSKVAGRLSSVKRLAPQVESSIAEIESALAANSADLRRNRLQMEAVRNANDRVQEGQDEIAKRALVIGRIGLFLESLPELPNTIALEEDARRLRERRTDLENELSDESVKERVGSILSILGTRMTEWAKELRLEHSQYPLRLDLRRLTVVADTKNGPVPMERMGSGENWVGYHLIAHLALHEWFTQQNRPVPRFLFLDQPSQVYFPPERVVDGSIRDVDEEDRQAVMRMFRLVFDVAESLAPHFQVVITEHADIAEEWFQRSVAERWRGGLKLVPEDWPGVE